MKEVKNKLLAIIVFILVISITITIVQLVGIGADLLRKHFGLSDGTQTERQIEPQKIATTTENRATSSKENMAVSDYDKYKAYKKIEIYTSGHETPSNYIAKPSEAINAAGKKIKITGEIEDAYIYIYAGANDVNGKFSSIIKQYDGIWFYLKNGQFLGGQLNLSKSVYGQTSDLTALLYNLKNVPVAKNLTDYRNNIYTTKNLLSELKDDRYVGALVSTQRYGKIESLVIAYKCAENNDCKIELVD